MRLCLLRETIAGVPPEAETALALQGLGSYPILQSGSPETVERWIPGVVAGDLVAAFALTEPEAGSDAAALSLRGRSRRRRVAADRREDVDLQRPRGRRLHGLRPHHRGRRRRGVTAFAVAGDAEGLSGEHLDLLSPHPIGRLVFDGVRVTPDDVLGEVDAGFRVAMRTLDLFRPSVGAFAVGMAQAAIDATLDHVDPARCTAARSPSSSPWRTPSANLATRVEAARLLVRGRGRLRRGADRGKITRSAAMAKLFATEAAQTIVDQCVQLHGARALERGHLLEHLYRDVRAPRIYEGASEVQRSIIARELFRRITGGTVTRFRLRTADHDWEHFDFAVADGVATVTLNRPEKLNPLTFESYADLRDLLAELPHHAECRCS